MLSVSFELAQHWYYQTGSLKTLNRSITVTFSQVYVSDDSDDLSAGDLTFYFNINGNWDWFKSIGELQVASGQSIFPNQTRGFGYQPYGYYNKDTLSLAVQVQDDDCDFWDGLCSYGIGPDSADFGFTPCRRGERRGRPSTSANWSIRPTAPPSNIASRRGSTASMSTSR